MIPFRPVQRLIKRRISESFFGKIGARAREKELARNHHDPKFFRGVARMILMELLRPYKEGLGIEVWAKIIQEEVDKVKPKKDSPPLWTEQQPSEQVTE
jgi:hypothetical protein